MGGAKSGDMMWYHLLIGSDWVDVKDPTVVAETELLNAAAAIEDAAKKLEQMQPRPEAVSYLLTGKLWYVGLAESQ